MKFEHGNVIAETKEEVDAMGVSIALGLLEHMQKRPDHAVTFSYGANKLMRYLLEGHLEQHVKGYKRKVK